jgi:antitoxin MazE
MHVLLRPIGNSQGIVIPKPLLSQIGLEAEVEMTVEDGAIVLRRPRSVRAGWADAARALAQAGDDTLVMGEFSNDEDAEQVW